MFEELNNRRKAVEENILKSFFVEESYIEKGECDELEKAREKKTFAIGDTFTRHGVTYKCTGISPNTGRPTWSKVKDTDNSGNSEQKNVNSNKEISHKEIVDFFEKNADRFLEFKSGDLEGTDLEKEFKKYSKYAKLGKSFDSSEEEDWEVYKTNKELSGYDVIDVGEGTDAFVALLIKKQQDQSEKKEEKMKNISDLQVGDEVTIVTDNNGNVTKKKGKITSVTSSSYEINGDHSLRFQRRTGNHVGMNNVKITIS